MTVEILKPASALLAQMSAGQLSAVDLLRASFDQVDRLNPVVNAVIWQDREAAMAQAVACDAERAAGRLRGPLHGLPVTVKESFDLAGSPTTWGNPAMRDNVPRTDSDVVARYRAAGAIVYGKTNVPLNLVEWQSFNEIYGTTSNPWDLARTPGGSSGGSAVALATGMAALEAGSDIGSSIRGPAHFCGIFGLKPTWNAVSMQGHLPPGWYGDVDIGVGGPMARTAEDLALGFDVLLGPSRFEVSHHAAALPADNRRRLKDFRIALMADDETSPVDAAYVEAMMRFADRLEAEGATVIRDRLPAIDHRRHFELYLKLLGAALSFGMTDDQVAACLAVFDGQPEDLAWSGRMRFSGMALSHRDWLALDNERRKARLAFDAFFEEVDIILAPVCASAAFVRNEEGPRYLRRTRINGVERIEPLQLFWSGYSGVVGLPTVVGPMDRLDGLPVGYQATGGHGRDFTCLAFARAVETAFGGFEAPPMVQAVAGRSGP